MSTVTDDTSQKRLHLVRLPGEHGPILRCSGELTVSTVEALRRELDLLLPLGHPTLTLNLSGCGFLDVDGILAILDTFKRMRKEGRQLTVIAGTESMSRLLQVLGIDWILPVFPSESAAAKALRGGGPGEPAPSTWTEARDKSLAWWRAIYDALESAPAENLLRPITSMHGLCQRAEEALPASSVETRCRVCPLFHALGGRPEDLGCRSEKDPMVQALLAGDRAAARARIARLIRVMEELPMPPD